MKKEAKSGIGIIMKLFGYSGTFGIVAISLIKARGFEIGISFTIMLLCLVVVGEYLHWRNFD